MEEKVEEEEDGGMRMHIIMNEVKNKEKCTRRWRRGGGGSYH